MEEFPDDKSCSVSESTNFSLFFRIGFLLPEELVGMTTLAVAGHDPWKKEEEDEGCCCSDCSDVGAGERNWGAVGGGG